MLCYIHLKHKISANSNYFNNIHSDTSVKISLEVKEEVRTDLIGSENGLSPVPFYQHQNVELAFIIIMVIMIMMITMMMTVMIILVLTI